MSLRADTNFPGWMVSGTGSVYLVRTPLAGWTFTAIHGRQFLDLNGPHATVSQTFFTRRGHYYKVSFHAGRFQHRDMTAIAEVTGPAGELLGTASAFLPNTGDWLPATRFEFQATGDTATLSLRASNATVNIDLAVDLVSVEPLGEVFIDQRHDLPEIEATHSIQALSPVVQEFTPSIGGLDVIEIWTEDGSFPVTNGVGATLQIWLRDDTTNGTVIAASQPRQLRDGWNGITSFHFTNIVWLEAARRYAIEVKVLSGDNWLIHSHGDLFPPPYPGGRYFLGGTVTERSDMWFRTGVRVPRPHVSFEDNQTLRWLGIPSMSYRVWSSPNLLDWTEAGRVILNTTNFAFTNIVHDAPARFYGITQP